MLAEYSRQLAVHGRLSQVEPIATEAVELRRRHGWAHAQASGLMGLAAMQALRGDQEAGLSQLQRALDLARTLGKSLVDQLGPHVACHVYQANGRLTEAVDEQVSSVRAVMRYGLGDSTCLAVSAIAAIT